MVNLNKGKDKNIISSTCPKCGESFVCGIKNAQGTCWCFDIKVIDRDKLKDYDGCLCESCLPALSCDE